MRSAFVACLVILTASSAAADGHSVAPTVARAPIATASSFALGGAVERTARIAAPAPRVTQSRAALTLPLTPATARHRESNTNIAGVAMFSNEGWDDGRDAFQLGTTYTQGAATAGVSVTYLDDGAELSRSELFVDYAINQNFSVGLAGVLDNDFSDQDAPIPQFGLNAAYETEGGAFLEGVISEAESSVPLFGLSVGLRF